MQGSFLRSGSYLWAALKTKTSATHDDNEDKNLKTTYIYIQSWKIIEKWIFIWQLLVPVFYRRKISKPFRRQRCKGLIPRQRNSSLESVYGPLIFMRNTDGCTWIIPLNLLYMGKKFASPVSRNQFYSLRKRKKWENSKESVMSNHPYFA